MQAFTTDDIYLECPVCLDLFTAPVLTDCCYSSVCRTCIQACATSNVGCPICRSPLAEKVDGDFILNRQLEALCDSVRGARHVEAQRLQQQQRALQRLSSPSGNEDNKRILKSQKESSLSSTTMQSPSMRLLRCVICLDDKTSRSGIICGGDAISTNDDNKDKETHLVCGECFPPYVQSLCSDTGKLLDQCFEIRCPFPECPSKAYESSLVISTLLMKPSSCNAKSAKGSARNSPKSASTGRRKASETTRGADDDETKESAKPPPENSLLSEAEAEADADATEADSLKQMPSRVMNTEEGRLSLARFLESNSSLLNEAAKSRPGTPTVQSPSRPISPFFSLSRATSSVLSLADSDFASSDALTSIAPEGEGSIDTYASKNVLDQYVAALISAATRGIKAANAAPQQAALHLHPAPSRRPTTGPVDPRGLSLLIEESLNILCPAQYCRAALDPTPDGCAAMRCTHCGTYFCWLCLAIQDGSSATHTHVRHCVENPRQGNVFLSLKETSNAHKALRIMAMRRALGTAHGPDWHKDGRLRRLVREDSKIKAHLGDCSISVSELFDAAILTQQQLLQRAEANAPAGIRRREQGVRYWPWNLLFGQQQHHQHLQQGNGPLHMPHEARGWVWVLLVACLLQWAGVDLCGVLGKLISAAVGFLLFWLRSVFGHYSRVLLRVLEWGASKSLVVGSQSFSYLYENGPAVLLHSLTFSLTLIKLALTSLYCVCVSIFWAVSVSVKVVVVLGRVLSGVR